MYDQHAKLNTNYMHKEKENCNIKVSARWLTRSPKALSPYPQCGSVELSAVMAKMRNTENTNVRLLLSAAVACMWWRCRILSPLQGAIHATAAQIIRILCVPDFCCHCCCCSCNNEITSLQPPSQQQQQSMQMNLLLQTEIFSFNHNPFKTKQNSLKQKTTLQHIHLYTIYRCLSRL